MILRYTSIILLILHVVCADKTKIHLEPSEAIEGYDFDNVTYGKNIMCLFWHSNHDESRMFKTAQWDMLHTQKHWYVKSENVTIANVDCHNIRSQEFCAKFIAVNITKFPTIIYSYFNEPFKKYNESIKYSKLTDFLFSYFERSCVFNKKHCKDKEEWEKISKWKQTSHDNLKRLIISEIERADDVERGFEVDRIMLIKEHQNDMSVSTSNIQNAPENVQDIHGSFVERKEQRYIEFTQKLWRTQNKIDEIEKGIRMIKDIIRYFPDYTKTDTKEVLSLPKREEL